MPSQAAVQRLTGLLLVAGFLAFLGHVVTLLALGPGLTTILFVLVYGFLCFLAAPALYETFRADEPLLALIGGSNFAAHGLFAVLTSALLLAGLQFPGEFPATLGSGESRRIGGALELTMDKIRTLTFVFMGLGVLPLGTLIVRSRSIARWVGWIGVAGGVVGALGLLAALAGLRIGPMLLAVPLMFVFTLTLGLRLILWENPPSVASD